MSTEELKTIIRRSIEALNDGNQDAVDELYVADFVCHRFPYPDIDNREGYRQLLGHWHLAFPDAQFTIEEMIVEGNTAAVRQTYSATHTGPLGSISPTDKQITGEGCIVYRLEDGRIVEEWDYWDELGFWQQLGVIPPIGSVMQAEE